MIGLKSMRQLADGRCFADSVDSHYQDHKWLTFGDLLRRRVIHAQNFPQLLFNCAAQFFWVLKHFSRHPIFNRFQNVVRRRDADIRPNHDGFELFEHVRIDLLLAFDEILNLLREVLLRLFDGGFDLLEYRWLFFLRRSE
jgi:hypothetical protein